jgi:hypothetical protein
MNASSTPYAVGGEAIEKWINGPGSALETQGHQGEAKIRVTTHQAGAGGDGVMGEAQTMREKGEVWGCA